MTRSLKGIVIAALFLVVAAPTLAQPAAPASPIATEQLGGTQLTIAPSIGYERATLRVSGPGGYALSRDFAGEQINVDLAAASAGNKGRLLSSHLNKPLGAEALDTLGVPILVDGRYKYEVVFGRSGGKDHVFTGMFFVEGGVAVSREVKRAELANVRQDLALGDGSSGASESSNAPAFNVDDRLDIFDTADDGTTLMWLQSDFPTLSNWHLRNEQGDIRFREYYSGGNIDRFTIGAGGNVGIGTTAPTRPLQIVPGTNRAFEIVGSGTVALGVAFDAFGFYDNDGEIPLFVEHSSPFNTLRLSGDTGNPQVGIGTGAPEETLHVVDTDPQVFVESTGGVAQRVLFRLSNNGKVRFSLRNEELGKIWTFDNGGNFTISSVGTGVNEFTFFDNGNMTMLGTLTQNSDRNTKEAITAVDPGDILAKVSALPIATWRRKGDPVTHLGPMAQDFSATFGLGINDRTIASVDMAGVSLAAIQALNAENEALKARLAELEKVVAALVDP